MITDLFKSMFPKRCKEERWEKGIPGSRLLCKTFCPLRLSWKHVDDDVSEFEIDKFKKASA
jgi:hypothetical protein